MGEWPCYVVEARNERLDEYGHRKFDLVRVDTDEIVAHGTYGLFGPRREPDHEGGVAVPGALWQVKHRPGSETHFPMSVVDGTEDHWLVLTPGGTFCCHCLATGEDTGWTVTGEAPNLTVSPSIWLAPGAGPPHEWHGFLTEGRLVG